MIDHPPHVECEVFVRAAADRVAAELAARSGEWADGLALHPYEDRGPEGMRLVVTGALEGSAEWWLETGPEVADDAERGVIVHVWLRGRPTTRVLVDRLLPGRRGRLLLTNHERRIRRMLGELKIALEGRDEAGPQRCDQGPQRCNRVRLSRTTGATTRKAG